MKKIFLADSVKKKQKIRDSKGFGFFCMTFKTFPNGKGQTQI